MRIPIEDLIDVTLAIDHVMRPWCHNDRDDHEDHDDHDDQDDHDDPEDIDDHGVHDDHDYHGDQAREKRSQVTKHHLVKKLSSNETSNSD